MNEDTATPAEVESALTEESAMVEEKPERKIFRGEIKTVDKLLLVSGPIAVQTMKPTKTVPGLLVINGGRTSWKAGHNTFEAFIYSGKNAGETRWIDIPKDAKMNVLSGTMATKLFEKYREAKMSRLHELRSLSFRMGCDPEIFVVRGKQSPESTEVVPAWKFLGSKKAPDSTFNSSYGNQPMYWDGFQAEFTTYANRCLGWMFDSVHAGIRGVYDKRPKGTSLSMHSVLPVDPEILSTGKEEHVQFGCMPSFNVYGLEGLKDGGRGCPIRFAGGHIHFGISEFADTDTFHKNTQQIYNVVYALDAILATGCVSLFESMDNPVRREWYGLPGEYRLPPHGLEYRTLSNAWLCHPTIANLVFEVARRAFTLGYQGLGSVLKTDRDEVISCILRHDAKMARDIWTRNKEAMTSLLSFQPGHSDILFKVFTRDVRETIADPFDLEKNWNLTGTWVGHCDGVAKNWNTSYAIIDAGKKL